MTKKGNAFVILIAFICYLLLAICICFHDIYMSNDNKIEGKKVNDNDDFIKAKYDTEKFYLDNLSSDGYGFIKVYYDDYYELVELISRSENKTIMRFYNNDDNIWNEPFHMMKVGNDFYFEITYAKKNENENIWFNKNNRLFHIDLNNMKINQVYDSNKYELIYDEYAINNKYVFKPRKNDEDYRPIYVITRYDPVLDKEEIINDTLEADELFVYDDKLFLKCINDKYDNLIIKNKKKINLKSDYNYLSMDSDGNNIEAYSKNEYEDYKKKAGYKIEDFNSSKNMYFKYNGKKVYIKNNTLMYGDNVLYKPGKDRYIELYYTDKYGYVAICSYKLRNNSLGEYDYYLINIETKEIDKVTENEVYEFYELLY